MKTSTNSTHANAFARITKLHNIKAHEAKRNDQSAYGSVCGLMQVDSCLFAAPQGFATWTMDDRSANAQGCQRLRSYRHNPCFD